MPPSCSSLAKKLGGDCNVMSKVRRNGLAIALVLALSLALVAGATIGLYTQITVPPVVGAPQPDGTVQTTFNVAPALATTIAADKARGATQVNIVAGPAPAPAPGVPVGPTVIHVPPVVLAAATAMTVNIASPLATLSLPPALVTALAQANVPLQVEITRPAPTVVNAERPLAATVLGAVTGIRTALVGRTQVTIPINIPLPTDRTARETLLANMGVFALHSDGEQRVIFDLTQNIDNTKQPPLLTEITFTVDKFSQFAAVVLESSALFLNVGRPGFTMRGVRRDMEAAFYKGRDTMMPVRMLEEFGVNFRWDEATRTAIMDFRGQEVRLTIGSKEAVVNGVRTPILGASGELLAPELVRGRTMIPLRFVSENLGFRVIWSPNNDIAIWR